MAVCQRWTAAKGLPEDWFQLYGDLLNCLLPLKHLWGVAPTSYPPRVSFLCDGNCLVWVWLINGHSLRIFQCSFRLHHEHQQLGISLPYHGRVGLQFFFELPGSPCCFVTHYNFVLYLRWQVPQFLINSVSTRAQPLGYQIIYRTFLQWPSTQVWGVHFFFLVQVSIIKFKRQHPFLLNINRTVVGSGH